MEMYMHDMSRKRHFMAERSLVFAVPLPFNERSRVRDFNFWRGEGREYVRREKKVAEIDTSCNAFKQLRDVKYRG